MIDISPFLLYVFYIYINVSSTKYKCLKIW